MTRIDLTTITPETARAVLETIDLGALASALHEAHPLSLSAEPKESLSDDLSDQLADGAATAAER